MGSVTTVTGYNCWRPPAAGAVMQNLTLPLVNSLSEEACILLYLGSEGCRGDCVLTGAYCVLGLVGLGVANDEAHMIGR